MTLILGVFGPPRYGSSNNDDGHQISITNMQLPPMGMGGEFIREFQPPSRSGDYQSPIRDFPSRDFQPLRSDFPPPRGEFPGLPRDFQGPLRDFQGLPRDFQGPPRDYQGLPRDFQGPPREFQARGDFQSPRGDFPPRFFGPRGPMRPPMGPQQGGPRHRQSNGNYSNI